MVCRGPKRHYVVHDCYFWNWILQCWDTHVPLKACGMCLYLLLSRVTSAGTTGGDKHTTLIFNHGLTVSLWNTKEAQNKEYKIDYLYKLLTIFRVVSKIACGMFPTVGKVTNAVRINGHTILCQHAPNCH